MPSPQCTVNGTATTNGVDVASNDSFTIAIADTAGVKTWSITCVSTDDMSDAAAITSSLAVDSITKTATCTSPTTTVGAAMIFESKVNGGLDINGRRDATLTTRFGVFILTDAGSLRVGAFDETLEGSASFGWTVKINHCIRAAGASGLTPAFTGTLPIVIDNTNPLAPIISVNAANTLLRGTISAADQTKLNSVGTGATVAGITGTLPVAITGTAANPIIGVNAANNLVRGTMSNTDKVKLDASNSIATPSTLVEYKSDGGLCAMSLTGCTGDNLVLYSDGITPITMDGNATGNVLIPAGIQTSLVVLDTAITGVVRSLPLNWTSQWVATVPGWVSTPTGTAKQNVVDSLAECYVQMNLPHGCVVTNVYVKTKGDGVGPVPGNLPSYYFLRQHMGTLNQTIIGFTVDAGGATYRSTSHYTTIACAGPTSNIIDRATYRYYLMVTPEYGADSVINLQLDSVSVELTFPVGFSFLPGIG